MKYYVKISTEESNGSLVYGQQFENLDLKALIAYLNGMDTKPKIVGYRVILVERGSQWIPVIKEIRKHFNLSLADAKEMSETRNVVMTTTQTHETAQIIKRNFTDLGATIKIEEIYA